ncbi:hypothetical protein HY249_01115 [Candidatus Azambacteria bacterium]|nr:hypothetical protein [Candidatus Azambacteria bacterium]
MMLDIPFYSNLKDDTHCFQACLKMLLKHYFPNENSSFKYLDKVTFHKKNKWTWNSGALLFLSNMGFSVINIENFDYKQFVEFGEKYLRMIWTDEVFDTQKQYSDFKQERKLAKKLIKNKSIKLKRRWTNMGEVEDLFKKHYLIMISVNPYILKKMNGYAYHLVVITDIDKKYITFHDPGLPSLKNKKVLKTLFLKAMQYPYKESAALIAVKK